MVNTNIQGNVNLFGSGEVSKSSGIYNSGEFPTVRNLEAYQDELRTRSRLEACTGASINGKEGIGNYMFGFVGSLKYGSALDKKVFDPYGDSINISAEILTAAPATSTGRMRQFSSSSPTGAAWVNLIGTHPLVDGPTTYDYRTVVGVFQYNNKAYYIIEECITSGTGAPGQARFRVVRCDTQKHIMSVGDPFVLAVDLGANSGPASSATAALIPKDRSECIFRSFFIHKERLFIVCEGGVFFSKATDPMVWAVPDGGFVKVADSLDYTAVPLSDSVYITTTKGLHLFTYSSDPNADSSMRKIADGMFLSVCVVNDRVFTLSKESFYEVVNSNLAEIQSFEGRDFSVYSSPTKPFVLEVIGKDKILLKSMTFGDSLVFNINSGFTFSHYLTSYGAALKLIDTYYVNDSDCVLYMYVENATTRYGHVYLQKGIENTAKIGLDVHQTRLDANPDLSVKTFVFMHLYIYFWVPDGSEYFMKKFRHLVAEGLLPYSNFKFYRQLEGQVAPVVTVPSLINSAAVVGQAPNAFRLPLNCRGRSISMHFSTDVDGISADGNVLNTHYFSISNLLVIWSYTQRTPVTKITANA